jgi:hypothetical protein
LSKILRSDLGDDVDVEADLFKYLSARRLRWALPRLDLATRQFPLHKPRRAAMEEQDATRLVEDDTSSKGALSLHGFTLSNSHTPGKQSSCLTKDAAQIVPLASRANATEGLAYGRVESQ